MTDIRLLVLDIDGTIAGISNEISPSVIEAIQAVQEKGIQVAIATGRMYRSALRFHQAINSPLPLLAYNGAWIQNPLTREIHRQLNVPIQAALELLEHFEQPEWRSRVGVHFYSNDCLYVREINADTEGYSRRSGVEPIAVGDLRILLQHPITKVLALADTPQLIPQIAASLKARYTPEQLYLTQSSELFFETIHPQANKGSGVRFLAEGFLGLKPENVMAIGDNFNDLEMLEYAGLGIAMGDAPNAVKEVAQWVAPNVEAEGVAAAIQRFLL
ncbi:Cof-type HAD-IIB family hydrolase [Lusitaniella coriacea]|uniref:Cof-type HAD-IIB family hydrolase n=1 Tax=Lusitaniella coriacea TaxID=1983105 RepID=UPI003CF232E5